jgi:competence protein ComEA
MCFSRKQQQVVGVVYLLYGIWLLYFVYSGMQETIEIHHVTQPDPSDLAFYIDPPVHVNSANAEELQLLPGIGPVLAKRITAYREQHGMFRSIDSLRNIRGIGPKTVQKLRYYLTFPE